MGWNSAANAQAQANQQAALVSAIQAGQAQNAIRQGAATATEQYKPYSQFGAQATNRLATLMGLQPGVGTGSLMEQPTLQQLQMDPGYAFRQQQGEQAIQRQMAAGGLGGSGAALKAATRFGQDMASQEYGNAYNRFMANRANQMALLQNASQTGFGAAQGVGNAAVGAGTNLAANYQNLGQTVGQGLVNTGSAYSNAAMGPTNLMAALAGQGIQAIGSGLGMRYGQN